MVGDWDAFGRANAASRWAALGVSEFGDGFGRADVVFELALLGLTDWAMCDCGKRFVGAHEGSGWAALGLCKFGNEWVRSANFGILRGVVESNARVTVRTPVRCLLIDRGILSPSTRYGRGSELTVF